MQMRRRATQQRGFTLIEAMIALLVLAVGLLGLARYQSAVLKSSGDTKARTEALAIAEQKIEQLRSFSTEAGFDAMASGTGATITGSNAVFTPQWVVAHITTPAVYAQVTMTVSWNDSRGVTQSVQLASYIGRNDPAKAGKELLP